MQATSLIWVIARRTLVALLAIGFALSLVEGVLAVRQADFGYRTFPGLGSAAVDLAKGEGRNVYLTPEESSPLNFDFYPGDFDCQMKDPLGDVVEGSPIYGERRTVNAWDHFWGIEAFKAPHDGYFEIRCSPHMSTPFPLVLARPATSKIYKVHPKLAAVVATITGLGLAVAAVRARRRAATEEPER